MRWCLIILCLILPLGAAAQEADEDRGFLVGLLESSLGGEGRVVRIDGFKGLFSSTATIEQITIADADGIWITLRDVAINWTRSALLRGRIEVAELSAREIDMPRKPLPPPGSLPSPEASPFALPDLPAALNLETLNIETVKLGAPVLGEAATINLTGSASLDGGEGNVSLSALRTNDGRSDRYDIMADYANETRSLTINLDLVEAADGLISGFLNIPERPSTSLRVTGDGDLSDFRAELDLQTDGQPRLAGSLGVQSEINGPLDFDVNLGGDVTALFLPEYRDFFGPDISLRAKGFQDVDGALTLDDMALDAQSLRMSGSVALNRDRWPDRLDIEAEISSPDGGAVLLPIPGSSTRIDQAALKISYDSTESDRLQARVDAVGFDTPEMQLGSIALNFDGTLRGEVDSIGSLMGRTEIVAQDILFLDTNLARAIGSAVRGGFDIDYREEQPLSLNEVALEAADWTLRGSAELDAVDEGVETQFVTTLIASDLSAFAGLTGLDMTGKGSVTVEGKADIGGAFEIAIAGETNNLAVGIPQADAVLEGQTILEAIARRDQTGTYLDRFQLSNASMNATATAQLQSSRSVADFEAALADAAVVSAVFSGPVTLDGNAEQNGDVWTIKAMLDAPLDTTGEISALIDKTQTSINVTASIPDLEPVVPDLRGGATLTASAESRGGIWRFDTEIDGPYDSLTRASGIYEGAKLNADFNAELPELSLLAPQISGSLSMKGTAAQLENGWQIDTNLSGPYETSASLTALYELEKLSAKYSFAFPNVERVVPQVSGSLEADGTAAQTGDGWHIETNLDGPYQSVGRITALIQDATLAVDFDLGIPNVAPLAPQVAGPLTLRGTAKQTGSGWQVRSEVDGPYDSTGTVTADLEDALLDAQYAFALPTLSNLVPGVDGAARVQGTVAQSDLGYDIVARVDGPSEAQAHVSGLVSKDGTLDLGATGQVQLGLANPFLQPRNISGIASFDLRAKGPPALSSISGEITTNGTRLAAPGVPLSIDGIDGTVRLDGNQAVLDFLVRISDGGSLSITGPVAFDAGYPADIGVEFNSVVSRNANLFSTTVDGSVGLRGPLTGGASISGDLNIAETEVLVAPSAMAGVGEIPDVTHVGAPAAVLATIDRAGLAQKKKETADAGLPFPLDVTIRAPSRIFIRGRGIDAEFGGELELSGTSSDMISTGQFDLIRGRLDILSKRFALTEGRVQLQGRFDIDMRLVAETNTQAGTARIIVEGSATSPTVSFESTPEAPEDEILAQIFFGRDVSQLSAFQAIQLAGAVATLAGQGGGGQFRQSLGLDDLSLDTNEEGGASVRAGKYITENIYSDIVVGGVAGPEVSLKIDLTPNITVRGKTDAEGNTGVGLFISKDY